MLEKQQTSKLKLKTEHHQQNKQRTTNTTRPTQNKEKTREADSEPSELKIWPLL
jgi:hypothetical protein